MLNQITKVRFNFENGEIITIEVNSKQRVELERNNIPYEVISWIPYKVIGYDNKEITNEPIEQNDFVRLAFTKLIHAI